jgi:hypothetical protein
MTLRIVCAIMSALVRIGCNQDTGNAVMPPPVALTSGSMGVFRAKRRTRTSHQRRIEQKSYCKWIGL